MSTGKKAALIVILILIADQIIKIWVKTSMHLGESHNVLGSWFQLAFTENTGFAFGWSLGGSTGKLVLSLFRIAAVGFITWYLAKLVKKTVPFGVVVGGALLLAGAAGNIIDCAFYGLIFDKGTVISPELNIPMGYSGVAQLTCNGGYAGFLHGSVVDMFYFPIISGTFPSWLPFWGGEEFVFFRPIFNLADASISIGIIYLILFQRKFLRVLFK